MKYLIPSYMRADSVLTVDTLTGFGIEGSDIYIGVQTPDDYAAYKRSVGNRANVVYGPARNCAGNRNNLLTLLEDGEYGVLLDDDVKGLRKYDAGKGKYGEFVQVYGDEFIKFVGYATGIMKHSGANLCGAQTGTNALYVNNRKRKYRKNSVVNGGCMIVRACATTWFDESFDCLYDIEFTLREVAQGRDVILLDTYSLMKRGDQKGSGGCQEVYRSGGQEKALRRLEKMYWPLAVRSKDGTSMTIARGIS